jgi:hypothetical protein
MLEIVAQLLLNRTALFSSHQLPANEQLESVCHLELVDRGERDLTSLTNR